MKLTEKEWIQIISEIKRDRDELDSILHLNGDSFSIHKTEAGMCGYLNYLHEDSSWKMDYSLPFNVKCKNAILQAEKLLALKSVIEAIDNV